MPRLYAPVTAEDLTSLVEGGSFTPAVAFGVTAQVQALAPDGDEETHEHIATQLAAATATTDPVAVAALDVRSGAEPAGEGGVGRFTVSSAVPSADVACFLVGDLGETVSDDADLELSWYDRTEIDQVRTLLR